MQPLDLIQTAELLLTCHKNKPTQASLRRATSTVYYALYHTLAKCCADLLVGGTSSKRSKPAWVQTYRALDHMLAKKICVKEELIRKFPKGIADFAYQFATMQDKRHDSDYNPASKSLTKYEVQSDIDIAKTAIDDFHKTSDRDKIAFCIAVLLKNRTN